MKQAQALDIMKTGANIFLTGAPGAGKTYVLNEYIQYLRDHEIAAAVTASTGIAATHIGGITIYSWSGIGIKKELDNYEIDNLQSRQYLWKRYQKTRVLIIDEISMLDGTTFHTLDKLCRAFKRNEQPFGGMQIIVVGDFFQLPPIGRRDEKPPSFAFESPAWQQAKFLTCYVDEQYRQDDGELLEILERIRNGDVDEEGFYQLADRSVKHHEMSGDITHLYTHNADVDALNQKKIDEIEDEEIFYTMSSRGSKKNVERLVNSCLSPETLTLKIGALVMCTKNNPEAGYANGTLGTVIDFDPEDEYPIIETRDGREITVRPATWSMYDGDTLLASIEQIPLRLAWAITVHKSQGMSLDAALMDLSRVFEYGQGYVALSRIRALDGLYLKGVNHQALLVHPTVKHIDQQFKKQSDQIRVYTETKHTDDLKKSHADFILRSGGSLEKVAASPKLRSTSSGSTYETTKKLLLEKKSLENIAKKRELSIDTILNHTEKLVREGGVELAEIEHLKPKKKDLEKILKAFEELYEETGELKLSPIKTKLENKYSYLELRVARLFFK